MERGLLTYLLSSLHEKESFTAVMIQSCGVSQLRSESDMNTLCENHICRAKVLELRKGHEVQRRGLQQR